ncbi:MAG TPA: spore photoproduct lyase [Firmicutes bacterium]|jgi:spore photoproduct lyase|nr:spore photoproduct lyase [Bacillota bacterium]
MKLFQPKRVFFETAALDYPLGNEILNRLAGTEAEIQMLNSTNRVTGIPGKGPQQSFLEGKQTLVVGVKKNIHFDSCKPSADFEFSFASGCPGKCQYCYLQTHMGKKPYIKVYVNIDEIFAKIKEVASANSDITVFEAASASDPLSVEHITGALAKSIEFFGTLENARMRTVTKFTNVESLLQLKHLGHTRFRFSLNSAEIIHKFEHNTASLQERIQAANKIAAAGYPLGFIIAPLFIYPGYEEGYADLFRQLSQSLKNIPADMTFELISHRFTGSAKKIISERFPGSALDLDETSRRRKYGKYGLVKYVYPEMAYVRLKENIISLLGRFFPASPIEYFT